MDDDEPVLGRASLFSVVDGGWLLFGGSSVDGGPPLGGRATADDGAERAGAALQSGREDGEDQGTPREAPPTQLGAV